MQLWPMGGHGMIPINDFSPEFTNLINAFTKIEYYKL